MILKWLVNHIIKIILCFIMRIEFYDLEKIPHEGPLLLAVNHVNFLDVPVVVSQLYPRPTTCLVKKETWDAPVLAFLFNVWGGIPINREIADFTAFRKAMEALSEGKILAIAPEGTRTEDGQLIRGKPGIAMLASKCDVTILPLAFYGHEKFKQNIRRLKKTLMTIRVGEPFHINMDGQVRDKDTMQGVTDAIMLEIAKLLPEEYRGVYTQVNGSQAVFLNYLH